MIVDKTEISHRKDFSKYKFNNWRKIDIHNNDIHDILYYIDLCNASIWLTRKGALSYKLSKDAQITTLTNTRQVEVVFNNFLYSKGASLHKDITFLRIITVDEDDEPTESQLKALAKNVPVEKFKMVEDDDFNPFMLEEFFKKDNSLIYRNIFKPTKYLQLQQSTDDEIKINTKEIVTFKAIKRLIVHLANDNLDRYKYIINWLAYFFQGLDKSQVALVLRGNQGAGKGIFYNEIIKPLFGAEYCVTINDKSLQSSYLGGIVENKIFFNMDEISHQKAASSSIKNFLKALVTNETITAEKKFETLNKETKLYGQILITSNEIQVLDVEEGDRRYTVFDTGNNLMYNNYLGYKKYSTLSNVIEEELKDFAQYLKNVKVDIKLANAALSTPEKEKLQQLHIQQEQEKIQRMQKNLQTTQVMKINNAIIQFATAIRTNDKAHFTTIKFDNYKLYTEIMEDFAMNRFQIKNLLPAFQLLHSDEMRIKYVSILLKELAKYDPYQFNHTWYKNEKIEDEHIDYIQIIPYIQSAF